MVGVFTTSFWTPETKVWALGTSRRTAGTAESVFIGSAFWEREVSNGHCSSDRTHGKDPKNIFEAQPPGGDGLFIFLRTKMPRDHAPFTPLDELPLNICYGPAIESVIMVGSRYMSLVRLTPTIGLSHRTRTD